MTHDDFLEIVENNFEDIPNFLEVHQDDLNELFETGGCRFTYIKDGKYKEFLIELKISGLEYL